MDSRSIVQILADNLRAAMEAHPEVRGNQSALARRAQVRQTNIGYMLNPASRAPTKSGKSSPTLDSIDAVARALGMQTWQLIYPDPYSRPVTDEEIKLWKQIERNFAQIQQLHEPRAPYGNDPPSEPPSSPPP